MPTHAIPRAVVDSTNGGVGLCLTESLSHCHRNSLFSATSLNFVACVSSTVQLASGVAMSELQQDIVAPRIFATNGVIKEFNISHVQNSKGRAVWSAGQRLQFGSLSLRLNPKA